MFKLINDLLGRTKAEPRPLLKHPAQLKVGDVAKFAFLPQVDLSNKRFTVKSINTDEQDTVQTYQLMLESEHGFSCRMAVYQEQGKEYLAIGRQLTRGDVRTIFGLENFDDIFAEGAGLELAVQQVPPALQGWLSTVYTEEVDALPCARYQGDYRGQEAPLLRDGQAFDYYALEDDAHQYAVEVEVFNSGDTAIFCVVYLPLTAIEELWPAG